MAPRVRCATLRIVHKRGYHLKTWPPSVSPVEKTHAHGPRSLIGRVPPPFFQEGLDPIETSGSL
eukprot:461902-Karenia_brevis.AAC.1